MDTLIGPLQFIDNLWTLVFLAFCLFLVIYHVWDNLEEWKPKNWFKKSE
jgi:hypothetical protein